MPALFDPLSIKSITLRNRIGMSPMCQYSYTDGFSNDWQLVHLGARAASGAGLIIAEATAVEPEGRITPYDAGIWSDAHIAPLKRVTDFVKSHGAVPGIQIAHAGRKADVDRPWGANANQPIPREDPRWWQSVAPSPMPFSPEHQIPHELTHTGIKRIQSSFVAAAKRAHKAGFEWLELHAAHGYLIHEFYSPLSNQRIDEYGGSYENRIRFLLETAESILTVWPKELPFTVRISGTEWVDDGWTVEDSVKLGEILKTMGVDLVDCSSAGNVHDAKVPVTPGYQVHIAEALHKRSGIRTAAVGLITEAQQADAIIRSGQADLVLLGRELLRNPYWPLKTARQLGAEVKPPDQYLRAF